MKKDDVVDSVDRAGMTINDLYGRAWNTALNPTQFGWGPSVASIVSIPVLGFASIGQMVSSAVVRQVPSSVYDRLSDLGGGKPDDK